MNFEPPGGATARASLFVAAWLMGGCDGPFSTLSPAGRDAQDIATLFWWMLWGAVVVWLGVMGLSVYAVRSRQHSPDKARLFIIGGGTVLPVVVLTVLLTYGLSRVPRLLAKGAEGGPIITVIGERWWWRVRYEMPSGAQFELANELYLPVNQRLNLRLESADVIHSFWIPSIAGKVDMIPGRTNQLALEPTRTGVFGGACAEYCGMSHANMLFHAVVVEENDFQRWATKQQAPAVSTADPGRELFTELGCGACHTIRGTPATGQVGPDLTHVGSRQALGAGVLANDVAGFHTWLTRLHAVKPGANMPSFNMLPDEQTVALARYLNSLE